MEEIINAYMDSNGSKSSSTRSTLKQGLKRLEKIFNKDFDKLKIKDFSNSESVVDKITNLYSLNTTIGTILSIIRFLIFKESGEKIIQEYRDILNELIQERNGGSAKQEFKEGEEENWIDYEELRDKVLKLSEEYLQKKKSFTEYRNFLILSLFVLIPPARVGNYLDMVKKDNSVMKQKIDSLPKKFNYIVKTGDTYTLIFNQYKTSKVLGKVKYEIKDKVLNKLIDKYLEKFNNNPKNRFFMINASGKPMNQSNFTNAQSSITRKLFSKKITNNQFRRIFFTHFLSTNPSVEEKQEVLRISGQNYKPSMVEKYDRKKSVESSDPKQKVKELEQEIKEIKKTFKANNTN
tara:strand:- start:404 stop:1450 length:1047 start_codon:yes stop_codon:yes gene_type:complete